MATKYEFENREGLTFIQCSDEEQIEIIKAKTENRCEVCDRESESWADAVKGSVDFDYIYRTLKPIPTPNQINWPLVPPEYKYCFFVIDSLYVITNKLPIEYPTYFNYRTDGRYKIIEEGDYGFKRGTVKSLDSLLIRPIGE